MAFVDVANLAQELRVVVRCHYRRDPPWLLRPPTKPAGDDPGNGTDCRQEDDQRHPDRSARARYFGRVSLQAVDRGVDGEDDGNQEGQRSRQREPPRIVGSHMSEAYATRWAREPAVVSLFRSIMV